MASDIEDLVKHPSSKLITYTTGSILGYNRNGPIISCGFREVQPSCTAIAVLDRMKLAGLAHINPFDNGVSIGNSMCLEYLSKGDTQDDISVIVAGTDAEHIRQIVEFFEKRVKVVGYPLKPNKYGVIDMAVNPDTENLLIYRRFSDENLKINFWS